MGGGGNGGGSGLLGATSTELHTYTHSLTLLQLGVSSHLVYIAVLNHTHTHTQCPPRTIKRLLDKNLAFHKAIAWVIILSSAIHVIAHWYNYERLLATPTQTEFRERFPEELRRIPNEAQPRPAIPAVSCNRNLPS